MVIRRIMVLAVLIFLPVARPAPAGADPPPPDPVIREACAAVNVGFEQYNACQHWGDNNQSDPTATVGVYGLRSAIELPPQPVGYELWYEPAGGPNQRVASGQFGTGWIEVTPEATRAVSCGSSGRAAMRLRWSGSSTWSEFSVTDVLLVDCGRP